MNNLKWSYKNKLRRTIYFCIGIPTAILCVIITMFVYNGYKNDLEVINAEFAEIQKNEITNYMNGVSDKMAYLLTYDELKNVLRKSEKTDFEKNFNDMLSLTNSLNASFGYDGSTLEIYTNNKNLYESKFIKKTDENTEKKFEGILEENKIYTFFSEEDDEISFNMVNKFSFYDKNCNIVKISANAENIFGNFNYQRENFTVIYNNSKNKVIPLDADNSAEEHKIFLQYQKGKNLDYNVIVLDDVLEDYTIYSFVNTKDLKSNAIYTISLYIAIFVVFGFFIIVLVNRVVDNLTKRIIKTVNDIMSSEDSLAIFSSAETYDEFDIIQHKLEDLKKRLLEENTKIVGLELKQLGTRISLHFLYNIFAAIKSKTKDRETIRSIEFLVDYCRNAFHQSEPLVTLKQEVENSYLYVNLLQYSYGKDFIFDIENELHDENCLILSDIVQPLIENSFIHGINCCNDIYGEIILKIKKEDNNIVIEVLDNALTADCKKINETLSNMGDLDSALKVINKKIKLYYGEKYGLTYFEKNGYTVARMMISEQVDYKNKNV